MQNTEYKDLVSKITNYLKEYSNKQINEIKNAIQELDEKLNKLDKKLNILDEKLIN
jgi:prefoldin subunit 5